MMKPTDEQLRDPKWWDENAVEEATHVSRMTGEFYQKLKNGWCRVSSVGFLLCRDDIDAIHGGLVPRPTKEIALKSDGKSEISAGSVVYHKLRGEKVKIVGHDYTKTPAQPMFFADDRYWSADPGWLIPILSDDAQKEEIVRLARSNDAWMPAQSAERIADAILRKYELKERDND